ncbi:MAG: peptide deformylase [Bacteroidetes bacterium]|jgi:peptide deformylase|nr:peptide deformylase [Bacteroidota bacterium]
MILPIRGIGDPVLKRKGQDLSPDTKGLAELIDNMFETMYNANGIGLAAPQVGLSYRLFVVDTHVSIQEDTDDEKGIKQAFINPVICSFSGDKIPFEEGCLSIPHIREEIWRHDEIHVRYQDPAFNVQEAQFKGLISRVFQHEFDHIEGILFTDLLSPIKKGMLKGKLDKIKRGKVSVDYPMWLMKK